jgi:hypothetical protein
MPGDDDGLTPDAAPVPGQDQHTRIADKEQWGDKREVDGRADEDGIDDAHVDDGVHEDHEPVRNRRDVPPTPENTLAARTEDTGEQPTEP